MDKIHQCKQMKSVSANIETSDDISRLYFNRIATQDDLEENHYLEQVGDIIEYIVLDVLYCPYCGEQLFEVEADFVPFFHHHHIAS